MFRRLAEGRQEPAGSGFPGRAWEPGKGLLVAVDWQWGGVFLQAEPGRSAFPGRAWERGTN